MPASKARPLWSSAGAIDGQERIDLIANGLSAARQVTSPSAGVTIG
jgi:hypothetical protein